uniref:Beta-glucosidase n=1 Tax=Quercus lobata TaxID=97700 RepID=A0A7N2LAP7_QUELO
MGSWRKSGMEIHCHHHRLFWYVLLVVAYFFSFTESISRRDFPAGFIFGGASSAYQYEGAAFQHGKGPSIWDTFTWEHPEKIADHSTGVIAENFYYRFEEDIALMKEIGLDFFRLSISWPRILPKGKLSGGVNQEGVTFYNKLINELLSQGLKPFITLFHWDVPQALEDEYGGFLSQDIVDDYRNYVDFSFKEFGDRVKYWITIHEPNIFTIGGLLNWEKLAFTYRWMVPKYQTVASTKAARLPLEVSIFCLDVIFGDYPETMRALVGTRLPIFTESQSKMLKGSLDFLGVNYYTARYADDSTSSSSVNLSYTTDSHVNLTRVADNGSLPIQEALNDSLRINYYHSHLSNLLKAIRAKSSYSLTTHTHSVLFAFF